MNKKLSPGDLMKNILFTESSSIKNLYARAIIAASICWGGMNMVTANYTHPRNYNYNNNDTVVAASYTNKTFLKTDTLKNINTITLNINASTADILLNLKNNSFPDTLSDNPQSLDKTIASYAYHDDTMFVDNEYYKRLRENDAFLQIKKYDINTESTIMLVNKTFQKAMIVRLEVQPYIYSKDSLDSFIEQGRSFKVSKNEPNKLVETVLEPTVLFETDCSTAKTYGVKEFDGDSKTPEGIFTIYSVEDSRNWTYDGALAFGPKFFRIKNSIGIHGNGTDTSGNGDLSKNGKYIAPEPLGIYINNFGVGLSHGCVRLENSVVDKLTDEGMLKNGTRVIIFENKELTKLLSRYYRSAHSKT
jgi:lipoprotein-anchoring transpeptidase ErfK/SrfK